jgi:hypothetical protein
MECCFSSGSIDTGTGSQSPFQQLQGGPEAVEIWYTSGCYFKAPQTLNPQQLRGTADIVLEAGAVVEQMSSADGSSSTAGAGTCVVRWLLCYSNEGDRRLKWARNEVYRAA